MSTTITQYNVPGAIHMHSDYSHDGQDSLEQLRDACLERGIRFVGMTDHAEDFLPEVFPEYLQHCDALSDDKVRFVPGLEFRFSGYKGLHLLALGLRTWITPRSPEEFAEQTRGVAQFTVLAHPVLCRYQIPQVVLDHIDGIEVWNANYNTRFLPDPVSIRIVRELRQRRPEVVATVGLDQHDSRNDRETRSLIAAGDLGDPLGALKAGRFANAGRTMRFDARAELTPWQRRKLIVTRPLLDATNGAHERIMHTLRRMGVA